MRESYLNIHIQTLLEEVMEILGPLVLILERWDALGGDEEESTKGRVLHVRRLSLGHLDQHDAERPDVNLGAIIVTTDKLWCHPFASNQRRVWDKAKE